jgi:hypothetical protein
MQSSSRIHYPLADSPLLQSPNSRLVALSKLESYIAITSVVIDEAVTSENACVPREPL